MTLVVVRHAWAGQSSEWDGDDRLRPLDERGRGQAARLPDLLAEIDVRRIVSSPLIRCLQTVEPLAAARGVAVEAAAELADDRHEADGPPFLRALFGQDAVACVHGGIEDRLGIDLPFPKGAVWIFEDDGLRVPRVLEA